MERSKNKGLTDKSYSEQYKGHQILDFSLTILILSIIMTCSLSRYRDHTLKYIEHETRLVLALIQMNIEMWEHHKLRSIPSHELQMIIQQISPKSIGAYYRIGFEKGMYIAEPKKTGLKRLSMKQLHRY